jgi:hypothetical protein
VVVTVKAIPVLAAQAVLAVAVQVTFQHRKVEDRLLLIKAPMVELVA